MPVALTWAAVDPPLLRGVTRARAVEGGALLAGLLAVSVVAFDTRFTHAGSASLLVLPVPFLIWGALRFGPPLTSAAFMAVAFLVIWGAAHGRGPFMHPATPAEAPAIQLFLVTLAVPLLLLPPSVLEPPLLTASPPEPPEARVTSVSVMPTSWEQAALHSNVRPNAERLRAFTTCSPK